MNFTSLLVAGAEAYQGSSVLTGDVKEAIQHGMLDLSATVTDVLLISVGVIVGVIALTAGVNFAMSKVRSIASWAS